MATRLYGRRILFAAAFSVLPELWLLPISIAATVDRVPGMEIAFRPGYPDFCKVPVRDWWLWREGFEGTFNTKEFAKPALDYLASLAGPNAKLETKARERSFDGIQNVTTLTVTCNRDAGMVDTWRLGVVEELDGRLWRNYAVPMRKGATLTLRLSPQGFTERNTPFDFELFNPEEHIIALRDLLPIGSDSRYIHALFYENSSIDRKTKDGSEEWIVFHRAKRALGAYFEPVVWITVLKFDSSGLLRAILGPTDRQNMQGERKK